MKTAWFIGVQETDSDPRDLSAIKQERRELVGSAAPTLEILKKILQKRLNDIRQPVQLSAYEMPSWPYLMADRAGQERALLSTIELLDLESNE